MAQTLDELQAEIGNWGDETFPNATIDTIAEHFLEEVDEFIHEHGNGTDRRAEELADVLLLILHYAHRAGFSLLHAAEQKMAINRARTWKTEPEPAGHFKHEEARIP